VTIEEPGPPRSSVLATDYMVASSHPAVSGAGYSVLARGGNAIDATLSMAAMSWIAMPGQCGVGGDAFALVREPDGSVWTVGGSGFGPDGGELGFYRERGYEAIPLSGALAIAVPGAPAALLALHGRGATRGLEELWAPAERAAEHGLPCTARTRGDILDHETALRADPGTMDVYLRDGRAPMVGDVLPNPDLARSIRLLSVDPACFYQGELAERSVRALVRMGAPFQGDEWVASGDALVGPAITVGYQGRTLHQTPLPTPGWMVLQQAALLAGRLADIPVLSAAAVHLMAEAARQAFHDRWERCGSDNVAWRSLLEPGAISARRRRLSDRPSRSTALRGVSPDGDTTSTVAVDPDGRAVAFIHSLGLTFGAHISIPRTGIIMNNRLGRGAYLIDGHPNAVKPRRRPLHTLNSWLVTDDDGEIAHVGNTPGGDGQVQWNMQLISHLTDNELDPQQAVTAPRFTVFPGSDANVLGSPDELVCETRLGAATLGALRALGHKVRTVGPWGAGGSALVVSADKKRGLLVGGADPRQDGVVLGG
jgi:gamma-glutamyltranspeptidase / glutathione hydrolase